MEQKVVDAVVKKYGEKYPNWKNVRVLSVIDDTFRGTLAVVTATSETGHKFDDEICFVSEKSDIRIFESTVELANFLSDRAKETFFGWIRTRSGFAVTLITLLLILFGVLFVAAPDQQSTILGSFTLVFGAAVGSVFGQQGSANK